MDNACVVPGLFVVEVIVGVLIVFTCLGIYHLTKLIMRGKL